MTDSPGPDLPAGPDRVVVEADGGSRGNPGPAAYGALLRAADGTLLAEDGERIGTATNNVAEYRGLLAGLHLARDHAPGARVEVRMDSKLVVEQMSGRWRIKHADMRDLAGQAAAVAPAGTTYTWVPRERNAHADRLANEALDGTRSGVTTPAPAGDAAPAPRAESLVEEVESPASTTGTAPTPARGWGPGGAATTLLLVRHGVTPHTLEKRFSGGLASANPGLSDEGRDQVRSTARWLAPAAERIGAVVASPVRRTLESAEIVGEELGLPVAQEPGFAEMEFGVWDGLTFAEVAARDQAGLDAWLGSLDAAPQGGESFATVQRRVLAGLDRLLEAHAGTTVAVVSHVTPIKTLVAHALGAPLDAVFAMELAPASVTVVSFYPDAAAPGGRRGSLRLFNALPPGRDGFAATTW